MLNEVFGPLIRAARVIFKDDIRVARGESGVRVWLHDGEGPALPPGELARRQAAEREQQLLARMCADIRALFDDQPGSRQRMRELSQFEKAFREQGLTALQAVPLPTLRLALTQFESEVIHWGPEGLACLRSKMAVALHDREVAGEEDHGLDQKPSDVPALSVTEVDVELDAADPDEAALLAAYGVLQGGPASDKEVAAR